MIMEPKVLLGRGKEIVEIPESTWRGHLTQVPEHGEPRLKFMTEAHHRVRYYVVKALADLGKPIEPERIAGTLNLPPAQVADILDLLEQKLFFLVRNVQGAVAWAYPVTVEPTPHRLSFSSGERLYAA